MKTSFFDLLNPVAAPNVQEIGRSSGDDQFGKPPFDDHLRQASTSSAPSATAPRQAEHSRSDHHRDDHKRDSPAPDPAEKSSEKQHTSDKEDEGKVDPAGESQGSSSTEKKSTEKEKEESDQENSDQASIATTVIDAAAPDVAATPDESASVSTAVPASGEGEGEGAPAGEELLANVEIVGEGAEESVDENSPLATRSENTDAPQQLDTDDNSAAETEATEESSRPTENDDSPDPIPTARESSEATATRLVEDDNEGQKPARNTSQRSQQTAHQSAPGTLPVDGESAPTGLESLEAGRNLHETRPTPEVSLPAEPDLDKAAIEADSSETSQHPSRRSEPGTGSGFAETMSRWQRTAGWASGNRTDRASAPRVDGARFVGRVARAFQIAQQRDGTLQLRLSPPELGSLRLEVSVQQGALTATIDAETTTARNMLMDNLPALRERLAEQNIKIERFDVDVRHDGGGNGQFEPQQGRDDQPQTPRRGSLSPGAHIDEEQRPPAELTRQHTDPNANLDLFI